MNVGTLTISLAARTAALTAASARVKSFETGIVASAQRANRSLLMLGQTFSALTIPIAAIGVTATKMFSDFEFSLAKVEGLVGIAGSKVRQWGDEILKMAPSVAQMPKDLGEALYFVTSAGIRGAETMDVLEKSALAASAGLGSTKDVADAVTSAMNAYGKENLSAAEATDILVMAVREGKVVAEDLASSIGKVFPVAAQLGVSFNEVGAAIASMTRTGTPASTSAIYLRRVLTSMLRPTQAAKSALAGMGESFHDMRKLLEQDGGLLQALLRIRSLVDQFGTEEVAEVFPNIRALIPVLDIIGKNLQDNQKIWENMLNPIGALDSAFAAASKTLKVQWNQEVSRLSSSMARLGKTFKSTIIPVIQDLVGWIEKAVNWWTSLDHQTQQLAMRVTLLVATFGPLTVVIGGLANAVLNLLGLLSTALGQFLILAAAVAFLTSVAKQFSEMKGAAEGAEDGIDRANTALENFSSNVGAYMAVALQHFKIFGLKVGIIFADIISGFENGIRGLLQLLIEASNKLSPIKLNWDVPMVNYAEGMQEELDEARAMLEKYKMLRPGGSQSWNWADQLFGKGSGFKEATSEVWNGFMEDANKAISYVTAQLAKMFPNTTGSKIGDTIANFSLLPIDPFQKTGSEILSFYASIKQLKPMDHLKVEDLSKQWAKFGVQVTQTNKQFERFGFMIDPVSEKLQHLQELMERMRERSGIISDEDLNKLKQAYNELKNSEAVFNMLQDFEGLVTDKQLEDAYEFIEALDLTKSQINGISTALSELKGFDTLFNDETLLNMTKAVASLGMTELAMKQVLGVASFFGDMFAEIGVGLGKMAAGAENAFSGLLDMLVQTFIQMGKTLAKAGAILAFIPGFQGLGLSMLIGGVALSAIGGFLGEMGKSNNVAKMANGGIIPDGYPNDTFPAMLSSNEAVIPLDRLPQMLDMRGDQKGKKYISWVEGNLIASALVEQDKIYKAF